MIPFAGNPLDRASEKRLEAKWIESRLHDPTSLIFPMWRLEPFLLGPENSPPPIQLGLLKPGLVDTLAAEGAPCIFLGLDGDRAVFALDISAADNPAKEGPLAGLGFFRDPRAGQGAHRLASAPRVLPQVWGPDQADGCRLSAPV